MNIGIFGSCVSRDACEYLPESVVKTYVARQSVSSLYSPRGGKTLDLTELTSDFQRKMVGGDIAGNGAERITSRASEIDLVLIDLADERRGFWKFPTGETITNSIEAENCGLRNYANSQGGVLVEFGTDEHFRKWVLGLQKLVESLEESNLWSCSLFLDLEWAQAMVGSPHPQPGSKATLAKAMRRMHRGLRLGRRALEAGGSPGQILDATLRPPATPAEIFNDRAATANRLYRRYREVARQAFAHTITRSSKDLRIDPEHRWGPEPFHYSNADYTWVAREIRKIYNDVMRYRSGW